MKLKLLVIVALIAAGGAAVFVSLGGLPTGGSTGATTYLTATAATGDITAEVAATGTIASSSEYVLGFGTAPRLSGGTAAAGTGTWLVESVDVAVGQAVKQGAVLASASTADLEDQVKVAELSLASAGISERQAKATLDDASGTDQLRQAKIGYNNAVNGRRQAATQLKDLQTQVSLAVIRAPIDGIVTSVSIAPGLEATGTAMTIAASTFEVTADVVESDISAMSVGQAATITIAAINAVIDGKVSAIAPAAAASSGSSVVSFPVTVSLSGAPTALRAGMTADISIVTASASGVLTIPSTALRGTAGSYRVQVMGAGGTPTATAVEVGLVTDTLAEIKGGLAAGDVVVTGTTADRTSTTTSTTGDRGGFGGGVGIPGGGNPGRFQP